MSKFVHMELSTDDPDRACEFYSSLFGWKVKEVPMGGGFTYNLIEGIGGIQKKPMPEAPTAWLGYIDVPNIDKTIAKAESLGARTVVPRNEVPGMGYFAIFLDPTGGAFALWEAIPQPAAKKAKKKSAKKAAKKAAQKTPAKKGKKKAKKR